MRPIEVFADDSPVRLAGVLGTEPGERGRVLTRLAAEARRQIIDPQLLFTATMPSGGRIELVTDATAIELDLMLTRVAWGHLAPPPTGVDLELDGAVTAHAAVGEGTTLRVAAPGRTDYTVEPGAPSTARFDALPPGRKTVRLWLPHNASVELIALRVDDDAAVDRARPEPGAERRWVHYGSSISHCMEALRPTEVWPVVVARRRRLDLTSLALAGQAQLDQFAARTIAALAPDAISLKIGINVLNADSMRERAFVPAVHGFLDTIRDRLPDTPILVVTPIVFPIGESRPGPTAGQVDGPVTIAERPEHLALGALTLERIRELITIVVEARQKAGDADLYLRSGLDLFGPDDLDELPDGLHPSPAGYLAIADRFDAMAFEEGGAFADGGAGYRAPLG